MLGLAEIAVIGAIVLLLLAMGGRSRRDRSPGAVEDGGADVWEARATIRIPKYLVAVLLSLAAAAAVAAAAIWLQFPVWVAALSGGLVAGAGVVGAMQRGRRSRRP
jgi:trimethylamine:corrinoid methyltransferase-like protein